MTGLLVRQGGEFAVSGFPALAKRLGVWWEGDLPTGATLNLPFAQNKNLIDTVSGNNLITFTRASGGSYVGADGLIKYAGVNEARFDHDPTTGESLGLLVEESRTNLLLRSEEFDDAGWTKTNASIDANMATAPSGANTADKFIADTGIAANAAVLLKDQPASAATTYTFSVYVKAAGDTSLRFQLGVRSSAYLGDARADFSFLTGTFGSVLTGGTPPTGVSFTAQPLVGDWYRLIVTGTTTATTSYVRCALYDRTTGDGVKGFLVWGAQLEEGSFPTSYIPTTGAAATRAADDASISGSNFSSWYRQDEGTICAKGKSSSDTDISINGRSGIVWLAPLATSLRGIYLTTRKDGNNEIEFAVRDDDGVSPLSTNHLLTSGYKVAGSYDKNLGLLRFSLDGEPTKIFNQPTLIGFNTTEALLVIGSGVPFGSNSTTRKPNSTISRITYYPWALTPSQIQALTS